MTYRIRFNQPFTAGGELEQAARCLASGETNGDGAFSKECQRLMRDKFAARSVLLTTSCTHALEMAAILLDLEPGRRGHRSVVHLRLDRERLRAARRDAGLRRRSARHAEPRRALLERPITPRTKAIVPVHYAGVGCEMDAICDIARPRHDSRHRGQRARARSARTGAAAGHVRRRSATCSFHETKNLYLRRGRRPADQRPDLVERAEIIREKGTDRSRFFRGQVDKYTWVDVGSSYLPSDMLAAFLLAQLEQHERIQANENESGRPTPSS